MPKSAADFSAKKTGLKKTVKPVKKPAIHGPAEPEEEEVVILKLSSIDTTAGTQARVTLDSEVIQEYADIITECRRLDKSLPFPPVDVFRLASGKSILADGFHRDFAHERAGEKEIACILHVGTLEDAIEFAAGSNFTHGLRRTNADKLNAVKMLFASSFHAKMSNVQLAAIAHVSESFVREHRPANAPAVRTVTRRGQEIEMNTSNIGTPGLVQIKDRDETPSTPEPPEVPSTHA